MTIKYEKIYFSKLRLWLISTVNPFCLLLLALMKNHTKSFPYSELEDGD